METVGLLTPSRDGWGLCPSHGDATTLLPISPQGFCRGDLLRGHMVESSRVPTAPQCPTDWVGRGQEQHVQLGAEKTTPALVCWLLGTRYGLDIDSLDLSSTSAARASEEVFQIYCNLETLGVIGNVPLGKGQPVRLSSSIPAWRGRSGCGWAVSGALLFTHPSPGSFARLREATVLVSDCSVLHCPFPHGSFLEESATETLCADS